jgi:acyl-CoA synthetase (AMP-forming)/AMP-acid ligase II
LCESNANELYGDVTFVNGTPSAVQMLLETGRLPTSVRAVELGGEAMSGALARQLFARGVQRLANVYGPTECTNECLVHVMREPPLGERVPIGRAIGGMRALVVDAARVVLHGVGDVGELLVGGVGVALGYLRRETLSSERFVRDAALLDNNNNDDDDTSARIYRTGDLVRVLADGALEFVGRADNQVKVRGFRVELEEVECALTACDGVAAACASMQNTHLVAHLLLSADVDRATFDSAALRARLARSVPAYMIPTGFAIIDELPLAVTGKVFQYFIHYYGTWHFCIHPSLFCFASCRSIVQNCVV